MDSNNKKNNYNYGKPIDLSTIKKKDMKKALDDFSEGSLSLKKCLITLWDNSLFTISCCKGDHFEIDEILPGKSELRVEYTGFIVFAPFVDIFSYLSIEFINNPFVVLRQKNNQHIIYFFGENKDKLFDSLANEVLSGKKENKEQLSKKINVDPPLDIYVESMVDLLKRHDVDYNTISIVEQLYTKIVNLDYNSSKIKKGSKEYELCIEEITKAQNMMYGILKQVVLKKNIESNNKYK